MISLNFYKNTAKSNWNMAEICTSINRWLILKSKLTVISTCIHRNDMHKDVLDLRNCNRLLDIRNENTSESTTKIDIHVLDRMSVCMRRYNRFSINQPNWQLKRKPLQGNNMTITTLNISIAQIPKNSIFIIETIWGNFKSVTEIILS